MSERVIHGRWAKFEENGDWRTFFIDIPGKDYPVRVSTKKEDVIAAAMELRDQDATFTVNEQESDKINPKNNLPYINRYLNEVLAGHVGEEGGGTPAVGTPAQKSTSEPDVDWDEKERRAIRSKAWAHTISALGHGIDIEESANEAALLKLHSRLKLFVELVYVDICRSHEFAHPNLGDAEFGAEPDVPFD